MMAATNSVRCLFFWQKVGEKFGGMTEMPYICRKYAIRGTVGQVSVLLAECFHHNSLELVLGQRQIAVAAAFVLGANYEVERWARISLGYTYSKYEREKRFSELQPNGDCYTDHRMQHHSFDLTAGFNALELWKSCPIKELCVWIGTCLGLVHAYGFTYNINMGFVETVDPNTSTGDNYEFEAWLTAQNTDHRYTSPAIPLTMSIDYRIHPQWSISLDGSLRFLLDKKELSPTTLSDIGISARYHFQ